MTPVLIKTRKVLNKTNDEDLTVEIRISIDLSTFFQLRYNDVSIFVIVDLYEYDTEIFILFFL
jgi:hypothetical protein